MSVRGRKPTNELEFQGQVLGWINEELRLRPGLGLDRATQEKPRQSSGKRSDLIVWKDRVAEIPFLAIELKTPNTPVHSPELFADAIEKAQHWRAPYFAVWNMREAELYPTPRQDETVTPAQVLKRWPADASVQRLEDWLRPGPAKVLRQLVVEMIEAAWSNAVSGDVPGHIIDAEIFVARLGDTIRQLREVLYRALVAKSSTSSKLRQTINKISVEQGFQGFVDDVNYAVAGQMGYRFAGQILFYFALRRKQPTLRPLKIGPSERIPASLRPYWDDVRRFDYEALFKPEPIDELVAIPETGQTLIRGLIAYLALYDWASLSDDVLGAVFERLIPRDEQTLLGQFYTPRPVADLLVALAVDGSRPTIVDPGCGSGTFLMSAYGYLAARQQSSHQDLLATLWGFDLSPFAAELAAINLYRQNLSEFNNFPRIVVGNFFDRQPGEEVDFPPARVLAGAPRKVPVPIPHFDCVLGNPPYLRSQNQDDLDPDYRKQLFSAANQVGIDAQAKTDLFGFFIYHALRFMRVGARLGFVTPASWLTSDYAVALQKLLTQELRLVAIVSSSAESFFPQVDVNAVLLVAERVEPKPAEPDAVLRFVNLKQPISTLTVGKGPYWDRVIALADSIVGHTDSYEDERLRIKSVSLDVEHGFLVSNPTVPRNWSKYLRAPLSYYTLFGDAA